MNKSSKQFSLNPSHPWQPAMVVFLIALAYSYSNSAFSSIKVDSTLLCPANKSDHKNVSLSEAMKRKDKNAIYAITGICDKKTRTPEPEAKEKYINQLTQSRPLTQKEVTKSLDLFWKHISSKIWWLENDIAPEEATTPLRGVAEVIQGALTSWHITGDPKYMNLAEKSGDFLLSIQKEMGTGGFGFPAWRDESTHLGRLSNKFLKEAEKLNLTNQVLNNGWIIDDLGRGDLYFDNGLAGEALLSLYRETKDVLYLNGAISASNWAITKPIVPNFNYNSFSVILLSETFAETGNHLFLEEAISRASLGVLSGMIRKEPDVGHWVDPHNERVVYRQVMIRAITSLVARMPPKHPQRAEFLTNLNFMVKAMFEQQLTFGISNPDSTMLSYCESLKHANDSTLPVWPDKLSSTLTNIAVTSLLKKKPFAGPAAVSCFLKHYNEKLVKQLSVYNN